MTFFTINKQKKKKKINIAGYTGYYQCHCVDIGNVKWIKNKKKTIK